MVVKAQSNLAKHGVRFDYGVRRFLDPGLIDFDASKGDRLVVAPQSRQVRSEYPLYGGILNFPDLRP